MAQGEFDDAIVSAGVMGLARAYHLAMRGNRQRLFRLHSVVRHEVRFVFKARPHVVSDQVKYMTKIFWEF